MIKAGSYNGSFTPLYYQDWVEVEQEAEEVETGKVKEMVVQADSAEVMTVEALGKVHMQVGMTAQVMDKNGLALSILVAKIERIFHIDI